MFADRMSDRTSDTATIMSGRSRQLEAKPENSFPSLAQYFALTQCSFGK